MTKNGRPERDQTVSKGARATAGQVNFGEIENSFNPMQSKMNFDATPSTYLLILRSKINLNHFFQFCASLPGTLQGSCRSLEHRNISER